MRWRNAAFPNGEHIQLGYSYQKNDSKLAIAIIAYK